MKHGFLLIDKQVGPTSHDVVRTVRGRLNTKRVGHAGTLDPFASGLLIVLVNKATRLFGYLSELEKTYTGIIRLGQRTDTDDGTGVVTGTSETWQETNEDDLRTAMHTLVGLQYQVPPQYSAKKIQGQPSYRRVRRGEAVELEPSAVTVSSFEMTTATMPDVGFRASVSTGTYVRALARDLGERLGCGAHLTELRREAIGSFLVGDAIDAANATWENVQDPGLLVQHLNRVVVGTAECNALRMGQKIPRTDVANGVAAVFCDDQLVAVAEHGQDGLLHPRLVLDGAS